MDARRRGRVSAKERPKGILRTAANSDGTQGGNLGYHSLHHCHVVSCQRSPNRSLPKSRQARPIDKYGKHGVTMVFVCIFPVGKPRP